jgi:phage regulator Rha-like protein
MLTTSLAHFCGVEPRVLMPAVKRNIERFPEEKLEVVTNCDHLSRLRFSPVLPYIFTEHGVLMLANILNSERAVRVSVQIVRTFVKLRESLSTHAELARKLEVMERKYDAQFKVVFEAIRELMKPPKLPITPKRKIGFNLKEKARYGMKSR